MQHRHPDQEPTTVKTTEAQALMMEIEQKNQRMRAIGLLMLGVTSVGVIAAVVLAAIIFNRQAEDREREAARREQQAETGNTIIGDIYDRLNHVDQLLSEHVGEEPLPPLQTPVPTTSRRTTPTAQRRTVGTTARTTTTTTSAPPTTTTTSSTTTTTAPPAPPTTDPPTCVGPVCVNFQ